jgi:hypothetical protein
MPALFNVTYEIVTPESAADGDADERGFVAENIPLREALQELHATRTSHVSGVEYIECDSWSCKSPRWITVLNDPEYLTGAQESRSLHIPDGVSCASRRRIAKLAGVRF